MKSWKTTAVGFMAGAVLIITELIALLDGNAETEFVWANVAAGLAAFGIGFFARDNDKSSEDVGNLPKLPDAGGPTDSVG